ncbi:MAG: universal stress protein [Promethearchaeota archaeon]
MQKKILVAVDGSKVSDNALEIAIDMAKPMGAKIAVIAVIDERVAEIVSKTCGDPISEITRDFEEANKGYLERAKNIAAKKGMQIETRLVRGTPATQIAEEAEKSNPFLIVLGCHGLSGGITSRDKKLIGSTAERVIRMCCGHGFSRSILLVTE